MNINSANRYGLDYTDEASSFSYFPFPIIDAHTHINGFEAVKIYRRAAETYGVGLTYSMTQLEQIPAVKEVLGSAVRFIAMPKFTEEDRFYADIKGYVKYIEKFYEAGARIIKFWSAPRGIDIGKAMGKEDLLRLDTERRRSIMKEAQGMKMLFMVHVGDPDTWFKTKYADSAIYGTKADHYTAFRKILNSYDVPFIAAHMGGWPENIIFLDELLSSHPNLYLDTSATKWMVRELSLHPREQLLEFFTKWNGRILFGSDVVTSEDHLQKINGSAEKNMQIKDETFDLYASRYWALRTLFEKNFNAESPIADPDLEMINPVKYKSFDAPLLVGKNLPGEVIEMLYYKAANKLLEPYYKN